MIIIEEVKFKTSQYLPEREVFWQHQLRVYVEMLQKRSVSVALLTAQSMKQYAYILLVFRLVCQVLFNSA